MSQKFSTFVHMINNKSNIEMQLATYKSMLTKASNDLAKSKQLVGLLKQQIEQGNTELSEELDKANERISMLSEDLSDANARIYIRKGKKDMWVVRLFFYQKQEVYCKEYKIARFNVPGSDPQSSKYPQSIIKGNPLMPSFCRFYLESKFAYHLSENRLLDMLSQMGMKVAQSTLNGWMQQIMTYLRERLGPVMLERIRQCVYTQNDESRIVVRSRESKEDKFKYNVEYIHAALSMEAKLCVMEYKEGSRSHSVQEDAIFKDSCIRVFTADRAVLYETIEKDFDLSTVHRSLAS